MDQPTRTRRALKRSIDPSADRLILKTHTGTGDTSDRDDGDKETDSESETVCTSKSPLSSDICDDGAVGVDDTKLADVIWRKPDRIRQK